MLSHLATEITDLGVLRTITAASEQPQDFAQLEAVLLKCIIDRLIADHKDDDSWTFRSRGLSELQQQFEILLRSREGSHAEQIEKLTLRWGEYLLDGQDAEHLKSLNDEDRPAWLREKVGKVVRQLWFIFVSLCRRLQENENYLTAEDAYWIGLVDEIIGRPDLPSPRLLVEYAPATPTGSGEQT